MSRSVPAASVQSTLVLGLSNTQRDSSPVESPHRANAFGRCRDSEQATTTRRLSVPQRLLIDASSISQILLQRGGALTVRAARLLAPILFNSALSIGFAWISALCYSFGDIFSHAPPAEQSHRMFLVAVLLWVHVFYCGIVWLARSVSLFHLHLLSRPQSRAGAVRMLLKMARGTIVWFVFSGIAIAGVGYYCGGLDDSWRKYRPEIYVCSFWYYSFVPVVERAARNIYRNETVEGRKQHREQRQSQESKIARARAGHSHRDLFGTVIHRSIVFATFVVPVMYVHSISFLGVEASTRFAPAITFGSQVFKIAMQEIAKMYILRSNIRNPRAMALLVAMPTVMIDTQVRVLLLRFQNVQLAVSTTIALACVEILTRVAKVRWLQRQIRRRNRTAIVVPTSPPLESLPHGVEDIEKWRAQLHKYHAMELSADMYAEYLAIGCSSAITVIFGDHPQFLLRSKNLTSPGSVGVAASLFAQIALEILVDFVSCVAELASGLDVLGEHERAYFLIFFAGLAVFNVNASAILYLAY